MKSGDSQNFHLNQLCLRKKRKKEKDSNSLVPLHLQCRVTKTSTSADMVWLYVNVPFQVKPLSWSWPKKIFSQKILLFPPRCVPSFKSLAQVLKYVNVQFQFKPLSAVTSLSQTPKKVPKKFLNWSTQGVCQVSSI